MVGELFLGLLAIGIAIGASTVGLLIEMRKNRGGVENMLNFLRNSASGNIDEKIAVLYSYANNVKNWRNGGIDANLIQKQIVSDMFSISRSYSNLSPEQWREVLKATDILIQSMRNEGFNTKEIEYSREALR